MQELSCVSDMHSFPFISIYFESLASTFRLPLLVYPSIASQQSFRNRPFFSILWLPFVLGMNYWNNIAIEARNVLHLLAHRFSRSMAVFQIKRIIKSGLFVKGKMIVMKAYKSLNNFLGFNALNRCDPFAGFRVVYIAFAIFFWCSMCFVDSIQHFYNHDFESAVPAFGMMCTILSIMPLYWRFLINQDRCASLLDHLGDIVNESMFEFCSINVYR